MNPTHYQAGQFPPTGIQWNVLIPSLGPTAAEVARYDSILKVLPNAELIMGPLLLHESMMSSRIEGTITSVGELLEFRAGQRASSDEQNANIQEVLNYHQALSGAERAFQTNDLSMIVFKEAHRTLLANTRGQHAFPGSYRTGQVWIGPPRCTLENAKYVPPAADQILRGMASWESYMLRNDVPDRLVQLAILHAEFERLHPFTDGNGRVGRMMIPLIMWKWGLIGQPRFYISEYLESYRTEYYDGLLSVSRDRDWTEWIQFFLSAIYYQAQSNCSRVESILNLYQTLKGELLTKLNSKYIMYVLDWLFEHPIFFVSSFKKHSGIPNHSARNLLDKLCVHGVVRTLHEGNGRRSSLMEFSELMRILES